MKSTEFTLHLTNPGPGPKTVVLEPWIGEYHLLTGGTLDVVVSGTPTSPLEVEIGEDRITIYAFDTTDAVMTAHRDGKELRSEH